MSDKEKGVKKIMEEGVLGGKDEKKSETPVSEKKKEESNESFLGGILIFSLSICLLAAAGYFGYAGYRLYRTSQVEKAIPSIDGLTQKEEEKKNEETPQNKESETPKPADEKAATPAVDKSKLSVKVLNGGSAKGVAGTYSAALKKLGYTQVAIGNTYGNYKGVTLYYASGKDKEAEVLKQDIATTYPAVTAKEAPKNDKDAVAATFVVILGQ